MGQGGRRTRKEGGRSKKMEETEKDEEKDGGRHGVGVEHPYLRTMKYRGGGYDVLRTFWDAESRSTTKGT